MEINKPLFNLHKLTKSRHGVAFAFWVLMKLRNFIIEINREKNISVKPESSYSADWVEVTYLWLLSLDQFSIWFKLQMIRFRFIYNKQLVWNRFNHIYICISIVYIKVFLNRSGRQDTTAANINYSSAMQYSRPQIATDVGAFKFACITLRIFNY